MSLNILLADDSVPAQNMGKKILVDAGYEVLSVSNGLEALRRIADTKPDIAILDIFMPGYTGLEICERLRANAETVNLPVILTVGKLEPYRPEDGEHVHSNAVIVKPFAAVELVSAVQSLIGRPGAASGIDREFNHQSSNDASRPLDPVVEPLHEAGTSAEPFGFVEPDHLQPEAERARRQNDTVFSPFASAGHKTAAMEPVWEPMSHGEASATAKVAPEPEIFLFNPDAGHTPFSASALEILPPQAETLVESGSNASQSAAQFELEPAGASYAANPAGNGFIADESFQIGNESGQPESGSIALQSSGEPVAQLLEIQSTDPLLELQQNEAAAAAEEPSYFDLGGSKEATTLEAGPDPAEVESGPDGPAQFADEPALSAEEQERRAAFEALFNSTEPFPVEEPPSAFAAEDIQALPNIAELSQHQHSEVPLDPELDSLLNGAQDQFEAPELDPYLMQEEEPRGAASVIPDRDPLLDSTLDSAFDTTAVPANDLAPNPLSDHSAMTDWPENGAAQPASTHDDAPEHIADLPISLDDAPLTLEETAPNSRSIDLFYAVQPLPQIVEQKELTGERPDEVFAQAAVAPEAVPDAVEAIPDGLRYEAETQSHEAPPERAAEPEVHNVQAEIAPAPLVASAPEAPTPMPAPTSFPAAAPEPVVELPHVATLQLSEAERVHQAVERVFDRFKPLLVAAIVRELARHE